MSKEIRFVHLRTHTTYSLLEGAVRIEQIPALCREAGMPAVAITDSGNLFGAFAFCEILCAGGIQPIIGCCVGVKIPGQEESALSSSKIGQAERSQTARVVLLCQNQQGYNNLIGLLNDAYMRQQRGQDGAIYLEADAFAAHHQGLILLSGGADGPLGVLVRQKRHMAAKQLAQRFCEIFGDRFYIELQRHGRPEEEICEEWFLSLAYREAIAIVASNEVYYPQSSMHYAHSVLRCIAQAAYIDSPERVSQNSEYWFKNQQEMVEIFADLPEAVANTVEIAQRCAFHLTRLPPRLPPFALPQGCDEKSELGQRARHGLAQRLAQTTPSAPVEAYHNRFGAGIICH